MASLQSRTEMDLSPLASGYRISNPPGLLAASYEGCLSVSCISLLVDIFQRYFNQMFHCSLVIQEHNDLFYSYFIRKFDAGLRTNHDE